MDLYKPTKAALELSYPRMTKGGVILVHDYFSDYYQGIKVVVDEFLNQHKQAFVPIGDGLSACIVKN
jgi:predicted O-methyltransferase YrrM